MPTRGPASEADLTGLFVEAINDASANKRTLYLQGGGSKRRLTGRRCSAAPLPVHEHRGIVSYRPTEMVVTARAGTPIAELVAATAEHRQRLPFDPGHFFRRATLGGTLATNLSGPARPWRGSVRDAVLGIRLINGRGELLRFGGEVMKNVAGYDVSRLQAGALGTLGLITEVSLRLLPTVEASLALSAAMPASVALERMRALANRPIPLAGACWWDGELHLAFEGSASAIDAMERELSDFIRCKNPPWSAIRNWELPGLNGEHPFWCVDLAPATPLSDHPTPRLIDWAGARRLYPDSVDEGGALAVAAAGGGHVTRMGGGLSDEHPGPRLPDAARFLHKRLKKAFDPDGIFNAGRLYGWL